MSKILFALEMSDTFVKKVYGDHSKGNFPPMSTNKTLAEETDQ